MLVNWLLQHWPRQSSYYFLACLLRLRSIYTQSLRGCIQIFWGTPLFGMFFAFLPKKCWVLMPKSIWKHTPRRVTTLISLLHSTGTHIIYKKTYVKWVKMGRNDSKFTISKYHINTMGIITSFPIKSFTFISNFTWLRVWFSFLHNTFLHMEIALQNFHLLSQRRQVFHKQGKVSQSKNKIY